MFDDSTIGGQEILDNLEAEAWGDVEMAAVAKQDRRFSKGSRVPARNEPSEKTYRGRVSRLWFALRDGRDVDSLVKAIKRHGFGRVSKATYYNWEAGTTDPPIDALPAIAKA